MLPCLELCEPRLEGLLVVLIDQHFQVLKRILMVGQNGPFFLAQFVYFLLHVLKDISVNPYSQHVLLQAPDSLRDIAYCSITAA